MSGWVKLHRELLNKAVWQNLTGDQRSVLITLLLIVNYEAKNWLWKGECYSCSPGQIVTSLPHLAQQAKTSIQTVRSALANMQKLGFLTDESTATGRLITLTNWELYQSGEDTPTDYPTDKQQGTQQTANRLPTDNPTATKEINKLRKEEGRSRGCRLSKDWQPSEDLFQWAKNERPELDINKVVERFRDYFCAAPGQKGIKADWDATFRNWVRNERGASKPLATGLAGSQMVPDQQRLGGIVKL